MDQKTNYFYIFSLEKKSKEKININKGIKNNNFLHKKTLNSVKNAQKKSLIKTLTKNKVPFREFKIKKTDEEILGKLFSYFMSATFIYTQGSISIFFASVMRV